MDFYSDKLYKYSERMYFVKKTKVNKNFCNVFDSLSHSSTNFQIYIAFIADNIL